MKIPVFVHTANPAVDAPLRYKSRSWVMSKIAAGVLVAVAAIIVGVPTEAAQYTRDHTAHVEPAQAKDRLTELGYDRTVSYGRKLVWVPSGLTWQMKPTYGSMSRHFGTTRAGLNFAPNRTTGTMELEKHQVQA
jgi:hypothetical protein